MSKTLVTSKGTLVQIGRELGKGGEGSVYDVPALANQVAKLYHQLPDTKKQAKLSFMANTVDQQLLNYVAWPQETLHAAKGSTVVGFLMPKVVGRDPIHMIYSPAHRRQEKPWATWDYLLCVARNTAAAFATLHNHGHILGDVNQGNILVGNDGKVIFIDSDSFQVNANGNLHLCEVGVGHFTPPELQGLSNFNSFTRTENHDNFGLALLIFHLLFGGRHPYSGVPLCSGVGDALETDIKEFRYAYARDAKSRGITQPPKSIELSMLPSSMESMFHLAFTEKGAENGRPTAKQWETALDAIRGQLKKCATSSIHRYPNHLNQCPWCVLEQQGVIYFINLGVAYKPTANGFILAQVWAMIEAIPTPKQLNIPNIDSISTIPNPLPSSIPTNNTITAYRLIVIIAAFVSFAAFPKAWFLIILSSSAGLATVGSIGSNERQAERVKRKAATEVARAELNTIIDKAKKEAGAEGFHQKKDALKKLRDEYLSLPSEQKKELDNLHSTAQARQKQRFLERFFIESADISGVGPTRKAALRSFGIETAADVSRNRILQVKGFGDSLTRAVIDWRASCERRFVFNPATAVSDTDKNAILAKFGSKKSTLETSLTAGATDLQRFQKMAASHLITLKPKIDQAAKKLAQMQSDLSLL